MSTRVACKPCNSSKKVFAGASVCDLFTDRGSQSLATDTEIFVLLLHETCPNANDKRGMALYSTIAMLSENGGILHL